VQKPIALSKIILNIVIALCIIPVSCSNGDYSFKDQARFKADPEIIHQIQEGDILLRQGMGPMSTQIVRVMAEKNPYSHCAIACLVNDTLKAVHCISPALSNADGVQTQELYDFFCDVADSNVAIIRPVLNDEQKKKFVAEARRYLLQQISFDHKFDFDDTTSFSCSELIYNCYLHSTHANPFLFKTTDNIRLLKFDSFFNHKYFQTIWSAKQK